MRVTIHQPEHLPWLGLLAKIAASDLWIVLDPVPYRKNYFQNRNRLLLNGEPTWLTVPVHATLGTLIRDVRTSAEPRWRRRYQGRLAQTLAPAQGDRRLPSVFRLFDTAMSASTLLNLNLVVIDWLLSEFGISTPRVLASDLRAQGRKGELIRNLCLAVDADEYIAGPSGRDYLDLGDFVRHGLIAQFFDYDHPSYEQGRPFVPYLSSLDAWSRVVPGDLPHLLAPYRLSAS